MVWGVADPSGFGDFFPGGDYVGWNDDIKKYFNEEMSPEQRAVFDNWDVSYRGEIVRKFVEDRGAVESHERPAEFRIRETRKSLGSLIKVSNRLLAADESLKEIIEELEPDVHQFWPLRITMPMGREYPVPYYGLVIRRFLDSFKPELSDEGSWSKTEFGRYHVSMPEKKRFCGLALSQSVFDGCHLWREKSLRTPEIFMSDALQAEIDRRGLRIPKHYKLKEV